MQRPVNGNITKSELAFELCLESIFLPHLCLFPSLTEIGISVICTVEVDCCVLYLCSEFQLLVSVFCFTVFRSYLYNLFYLFDVLQPICTTLWYTLTYGHHFLWLPIVFDQCPKASPKVPSTINQTHVFIPRDPEYFLFVLLLQTGLFSFILWVYKCYEQGSFQALKYYPNCCKRLQSLSFSQTHKMVFQRLPFNQMFGLVHCKTVLDLCQMMKTREKIKFLALITTRDWTPWSQIIYTEKYCGRKKNPSKLFILALSFSGWWEKIQSYVH